MHFKRNVYLSHKNADLSHLNVAFSHPSSRGIKREHKHGELKQKKIGKPVLPDFIFIIYFSNTAPVEPEVTIFA